MKHLRIVNLLVVLVLLAGWAPAPVQLFNTVQAPLNALAPKLYSPVNKYAVPILSTTFTGNLLFKWYPVAGTGITYNLELATNTAFTDNLKSFSGLILTSQVVDTKTLLSGTVYYWRVASVQNGGVPVPSAAWVLYTRPDPPSSGFVPNDGGVANALSPLFIWDRVGGLVKYEIRIMDGTVLKESRILTFAPGSSPVSYQTSLLLLPMPNNHHYSYWLRSYWQIPSSTVLLVGAWKVVTFSTPDNVPPAPVLSDPTLGKVLVDPHGYDTTLTWTQPTPVNTTPIFYHVQVATSPTFAPNTLVVGQDPNTSTTATGVTSFPVTVSTGGTFYWRVQGEDTRFGSNGVLSNWSKVFYFKTPPSLNVTVKDCINGLPISGATVTFTGTGGETLTTDNNGMVSKMPVIVGYHAITINKLVNNLAGDYLQVKLPSILYSNGKAYNFNACLKRQPIRIVMRWGTYFKTPMPNDLDSHLWLPADISPVTKPVLQVYPGWWGFTTTHPWMKVMNDAYGIASLKYETTVLTNRYPGKYLFAVRNFSSNDVPLVGSGAQVQVFLNGSTKAIMTVNVNDATADYAGSRWWYVLDINTNADGSLTLNSVNQIMANLPQPPFYDVNAGLSVTK